MATAENARMGYDTKDKISAGDGVTIQPIVVKVYSLEDIACIQQMVPLRSLRVVLDPRAVELHLGHNIKGLEDEKVKLCVRTEGDSISEGQSSACVKMEQELTMITMKSTPANEHLKNTLTMKANEVTRAAPDLDMTQYFRRKGKASKMSDLRQNSPPFIRYAQTSDDTLRGAAISVPSV